MAQLENLEAQYQEAMAIHQQNVNAAEERAVAQDIVQEILVNPQVLGEQAVNANAIVEELNQQNNGVNGWFEDLYIRLTRTTTALDSDERLTEITRLVNHTTRRRFVAALEIREEDRTGR
jgi:hypothetical protein